MSASTKVLIALVAVAAFAIGMVVNSAKVSSDIDAQLLVDAQLMVLSGEERANQTIKGELQPLTLVNFWASWCAPCRKEMPIFEVFYQSHKGAGFNVVGITIDSPENAEPMLDSLGVTYPIYYAESSGMQLMSEVGNPNGLLPYTLLLDADGLVLEQIVGTIDEADVQAWLEQYL